MLRNSCDWATS